MEKPGCFSCNLTDNASCEENCCGVRLCRLCIKKSRYCPFPGCTKYLKNTIQDIIIRQGYFDEVLVANKDQNSSDRKYGLTPLEMAIIESDTYMINNLIRHGLCDKNKSNVDMSIKLYKLEIIKILKDNDFPFDYQSSLQLQDDFPFLSSDEADKVLRI